MSKGDRPAKIILLPVVNVECTHVVIIFSCTWACQECLISELVSANYYVGIPIK